MIAKIEITNELEKELAISNEKMKNEKFTTIGLLSSRLSYDLRNPLTVIKTATQLMKHQNKDSLSDDDKRRYDQIEDAINNMVHQIEGVLTFVQTKPLKLEKISVLQLLNNALTFIELPKTITTILPKNDVVINCDKRKI